jgi:SagB-type dehydrogenase family enzyme
MMKVFSMTMAALFLLLCLFVPSDAPAEETGSITLPKPNTTGGKPLMEALGARRTVRDYSEKEIPPQVLSDLLWAAFGINRPESGKRTAPSARNWQEIDIYVVTATGLYRYVAQDHTLALVIEGDLRAETGRQPFVGTAPVNLVFVADFSKMGSAPEEIKSYYAAGDTGFISQNIYLFCASEGLGTVVRGSVDRDALSEKMELGKEQKIVFAQTVGYPKE